MDTVTMLDLQSDDRIAIAGDWHGDIEYALRVIASLPDDIRVLVHLGDFGYNFAISFLAHITQAAADRDVTVLFVDGNHENFDWLLSQPTDPDGIRRLTDRIWHLPRGFRWEWAGLKFLALGGAYSVDKDHRKPYISWWPQEEITYAEARSVAGGPRADVMFTHDCPASVDIPDLSPWMFSPHAIQEATKHRELLEFAVTGASPRWLFHGHYHVDYTLTMTLPGGVCQVAGLADNMAPLSNNTKIIALSDLAG